MKIRLFIFVVISISTEGCGILLGKDTAKLPTTEEIIDQGVAELESGGGLSKARSLRAMLEFTSNRSNDAVKLEKLDTLIRLGALVLARRDRGIELKPAPSVWPEFDEKSYGYKYPIFSGTDPETITDPAVREALKVAIAKQKVIVANWSREFDIDETAGSFFNGAKRIMEQINSPEATDRVIQALSKLNADPWIRNIARQTIFPAPAAESVNDAAILRITAFPKSASVTPSQQNAHVVPSSPNSSTPTQPTTQGESRIPSSWPHLVGWMVVASGVLLFLHQRRSRT